MNTKEIVLNIYADLIKADIKDRELCLRINSNLQKLLEPSNILDTLSDEELSETWVYSTKEYSRTKEAVSIFD